jgi:hypothetical protein
MFLGPSIEPEKASPKSASTANPPRKVNFIAFLLIIYRVNGFGIISIKFWSLVLLLYSSIFWYGLELSTLVFLLVFSWSSFASVVLFVGPRTINMQTEAPQTRDFTGAGNSSLPNFISIAFNISLPN